MDLDALRAFLAVTDTGSFLGAATSLRWSRATLRRRVDELEAFAGVPLLVRTEQGASPTTAGELLARRGRDLLAQSSALLASVREAGALPESVLRVGLPTGLPPRVVALAYAAQQTLTPDLRLLLRVAEDPLSLLHEDVDVVVSFGGDPPEGPWISREIARMPEHLVGSAAYLAERGTPTTLEELTGHPLFVWESPRKPLSALPLRAGGEWPVAPALRSSDIHVLRECAGLGLGLVYGPDPAIPDGLGAGDGMVPVLADLIGRECVIKLVIPETLSDVPRMAAAIKRLLSILPPPGVV